MGTIWKPTEVQLLNEKNKLFEDEHDEEENNQISMGLNDINHKWLLNKHGPYIKETMYFNEDFN